VLLASRHATVVPCTLQRRAEVLAVLSRGVEIFECVECVYVSVGGSLWGVVLSAA
jgi:hypothetical protein